MRVTAAGLTLAPAVFAVPAESPPSPTPPPPSTSPSPPPSTSPSPPPSASPSPPPSACRRRRRRRRRPRRRRRRRSSPSPPPPSSPSCSSENRRHGRGRLRLLPGNTTDDDGGLRVHRRGDPVAHRQLPDLLRQVLRRRRPSPPPTVPQEALPSPPTAPCSMCMTARAWCTFRRAGGLPRTTSCAGSSVKYTAANLNTGASPLGRRGGARDQRYDRGTAARRCRRPPVAV